jgi:hypothetical protein
MTAIILKNKIGRKKLHSIIWFLKALDIDAEIKDIPMKKQKAENDPLAEVWGIWADREVDARALRKETWKIKD